MGRAPLLSASILAADFTRLGEEIRQAADAGADWIHVDVMDGHFAPNLSMGPVVVEACRRATVLPIDVHLMVQNPGAFLAAFAAAGADSLTVHVEAVRDLSQALASIRSLGLRAGAALSPATPPAAVDGPAKDADLVLVMTVEPGYSGQAFLPGSPDKIREVRRLLDAAGSAARLQVDGGIDAHIAPLAAAAGADVFVAANAVFRHPQGIAAGLTALRQSLEPAPAGRES